MKGCWRCRGTEELGAYRSRIERLGVPDLASPRDSDAAMSWPCTPSKADHRSSPAPGLFRHALLRILSASDRDVREH